MHAAISVLWPHDGPLFDLDPPLCAVPAHPDGPCPVEGLEAIIEELQLLAMASSARRDTRLGFDDYDWQTIAEDDGVRVVIPA